MTLLRSRFAEIDRVQNSRAEGQVEFSDRGRKENKKSLTNQRAVVVRLTMDNVVMMECMQRNGECSVGTVRMLVLTSLPVRSGDNNEVSRDTREVSPLATVLNIPSLTIQFLRQNPLLPLPYDNHLIGIATDHEM